jgi:uncharacterized protein
MIQVSRLFIYPIKSLGGISLQTVKLEPRGFALDRRWMLVDENGNFLSQRTKPSMALLQPSITDAGIEVIHQQYPSQKIVIPFLPTVKKTLRVTVWDDNCEALEMDDNINTWFSEQLQQTCKLVYMHDNSMRQVDMRYAPQNAITSFSDGYPVLLLSEESMLDLNSRLEVELPINRFRPNLVIKGCLPYEEDTMAKIKIGDLELLGVKLCSRCVMTTINQQTAEQQKEPLKTLAGYRNKNNKIYFGQNVLYQQVGNISVGDEVAIAQKTDWPVFNSN